MDLHISVHLTVIHDGSNLHSKLGHDNVYELRQKD